MYVWDTLAATNVYTINAGGLNSAVAINPYGNRVVYARNGQLFAADLYAQTNGVIGSLASTAHAGLCFNDDGRFLVYAGPVNTATLVYLYDFVTSSNLLVSRSYNGGPAAYGVSDWPDISSDGRFIAYRSSATNIVPNDSNGVPDVFLYDRWYDTTTLLSVSRYGTTTAGNRSLAPVFSADAQSVLFQSWAFDVVDQDFNHSSDVFGFNLYGSGQIPLFSAAIARGSSAAPGSWIMWPVVAGRTYRVQFKNSLADATWQEFNGGVTIIGTQGYLNDVTAGSSPRFYRVVAY